MPTLEPNAFFERLSKIDDNALTPEQIRGHLFAHVHNFYNLEHTGNNLELARQHEQIAIVIGAYMDRQFLGLLRERSVVQPISKVVDLLPLRGVLAITPAMGNIMMELNNRKGQDAYQMVP